MEYKLLLASDGSDNAVRAAEFTVELLAAAPDIKVTVLAVNDIIEKMKYYSPLRSPVVLEEVEIFFREKTDEALETTMEVFKKHGVKVNGVAKLGNPARVIVDYARDEGVNHIVIGSRGLGSLKGIVLGSVSSKVIQLASCPVTVVK
ncbi:universal stress protein [Pelotomaculum propionicicum]|uniref:universal stress protein n=1 Tax=Pelotomaculum propionicicum TaxID=258475 RepID=UPI003B78FBD1